MPIYRWWRLRKLIRDTTTPIAYSRAKKWDTFLGTSYNITATFLFGSCIYLYFQQEKMKAEQARAEGKEPESNSEYWARKLKLHGARVIRFSGFGQKVKDEIYLDPTVLEEEKRDRPQVGIFGPLAKRTDDEKASAQVS